MSYQEIKYIHFVNNTDLPIMIDSWIDGSNDFQCLRIAPREKCIIHSSVGEWHINAMLYEEDRKIWDENEILKRILNIGKFRSKPCAKGNYSWLYYHGLFNCVYSELDDHVKGVMTFSSTF